MAKAKQGGQGTPATVALGKAGIEFSTHAYEHDPAAKSFGLEAAEALGLDPRQVFKTLLVEVDGKLSVGVVPVDKQLDLKAVAAALSGKKAVMADPAAAERITGYVVGGISPDRTEAPAAHSGGCRRHGVRHGLCLRRPPRPGSRSVPDRLDRGDLGPDRGDRALAQLEVLEDPGTSEDVEAELAADVFVVDGIDHWLAVQPHLEVGSGRGDLEVVRAAAFDREG